MLEVEGLPELGIHLSVANFDRILANIQATDQVIWLNDFDIRDPDEKKELDSLLYTKYEGKHIDTEPSCQCGEMKDRFYVGETCGSCHTVVSDTIARPYRSLLWMRPPEGVDCFINPQFLMLLEQYFSRQKESFIRYVCDPDHRPDFKKVPGLMKLNTGDFDRGLNYFSKNYRNVIQMLIDKGLKSAKLKKKEEAELWQFIDKYENCLFPKALPLPSSLTIVTESTDMSTYSEDTLKDCVDAARTISGITDLERRRKGKIESKAFRAVSQLAAAYAKFNYKIIRPKKGLTRRNVVSNLSYFSFRAIITSLHRPHRYDELVIGYGIGVKLLEVHLTTILCREDGMTVPEAIRYIDLHTRRFSQRLHDIMSQAIARTGGIHVLWQRNPTMCRGSIQMLRVVEIKTNPYDVTVEMSPLIVTVANADHDGDEMNGLMLNDEFMIDAFDRFQPHHNMFDYHEPAKLSSASKLPKQVLSQQANFLNREAEELNYREFCDYFEENL